MFTEAAVKPEYSGDKTGPASENQRKDDIEAKPGNVKKGEGNQQKNQTAGQPADILPAQSPELNWPANPFVDLIYGSHNLNAEEGFQNCGYYDQKDTGAEPGGCNLVGVRLSRIPFVEDFYGTDDTYDRTDGVHQIAACVEIAFNFIGCFGYTGIAVLGE